MTKNIISCPNCQAKNRLRTAGSEREHPRCGRCGEALPWLVDATDTTFDQEAEAPMPVLVDLWAPWCGPCRQVAPVLEDLSRDLAGRLKVVKVNVDENPRLAARFNARSIPMLVVMSQGQVRETLVGAQPKAALRRALDAYV